MKKARIILVNLLAVATLTIYHLLGGNNVWVALLIVNVAFSFADYLSYNWSIDPEVQWCGDSDPENNLYEPYRIIQYVLGIGLAIQLCLYISWVAVLSFAVWHFTFNNDLLFYLWHYIFNFWGGERNAFKQEILSGDCTWGFFTFPVGIYLWIESGHPNNRISGGTILFQAFLGILATILINLIW